MFPDQVLVRSPLVHAPGRLKQGRIRKVSVQVCIVGTQQPDIPDSGHSKDVGIIGPQGAFVAKPICCLSDLLMRNLTHLPLPLQFEKKVAKARDASVFLR